MENFSGLKHLLMGPQFDWKSSGSLKKKLETIVSLLEETLKMKTERKSLFLEVLCQLKNISSELFSCKEFNSCLDENNLSLKRLEELRKQLHELQNEKVIFSVYSFLSFSIER